MAERVGHEIQPAHDLQSCALFMMLYILGGIYSVLGGASGNEPTCQSGRHKTLGFDSWVGKIPWRSAWQPTPTAILLPGESLGQRSLVGYSPQGCKEWDTIEAT